MAHSITSCTAAASSAKVTPVKDGRIGRVAVVHDLSYTTIPCSSSSRAVSVSVVNERGHLALASVEGKLMVPTSLCHYRYGGFGVFFVVVAVEE